MTVAKADITTLAQVFCQNKGDTTTIADYFDETVEDVARKPNPPFIDKATFNIVASTSVYAFQTAAIDVLAVFFEGRQLSPTKVYELEAYDIDWRTTEADPISVLFDEQDDREYRLLPIPDANSASGGIELYSAALSSSIQEWYALYLAFATLIGEFSYIGDHTDSLFAEACGTVRDMLGALLEIE